MPRHCARARGQLISIRRAHWSSSSEKSKWSTPVPASKRTSAVTFDAAAVLKRKETEAAAVAHAKKLNDADAAVMRQGTTALENLTRLIETVLEMIRLTLWTSWASKPDTQQFTRSISRCL